MSWMHACVQIHARHINVYVYLDIPACTHMQVMMTRMMMILCPNAGSLGFTPPGDKMSEVASRFLPHRQLWVSKLSKVDTQWLEVD